jgi:hypothetical protein
MPRMPNVFSFGYSDDMKSTGQQLGRVFQVTAVFLAQSLHYFAAEFCHQFHFKWHVAIEVLAIHLRASAKLLSHIVKPAAIETNGLGFKPEALEVMPVKVF